MVNQSEYNYIWIQWPGLHHHLGGNTSDSIIIESLPHPMLLHYEEFPKQHFFIFFWYMLIFMILSYISNQKKGPMPNQLLPTPNQKYQEQILISILVIVGQEEGEFIKKWQICSVESEDFHHQTNACLSWYGIVLKQSMKNKKMLWNPNMQAYLADMFTQPIYNSVLFCFILSSAFPEVAHTIRNR